MKAKPTKAREPRPDRGDLTRDKLLLAAIDVFGRLGFEAATTRTLANAAGVNLQAIPYYFGGKEGLYVAAAEHIGAMIVAHVEAPRNRIRRRLAEAAEGGPAIAPDEARRLLADMLQAMAELFIGETSESWARFIIREQMTPTEAFARIYGTVMGPLLDAARRLVAILLAEDPSSELVRLRTLSLVGGVLVFRVAHAAAMAQLDWKRVGPREVEAVRALARELVEAIGRPEARS